MELIDGVIYCRKTFEKSPFPRTIERLSAKNGFIAELLSFTVQILNLSWTGREVETS
jgi:hypothetical protein